jgi:hypothetical protein
MQDIYPCEFEDCVYYQRYIFMDKIYPSGMLTKIPNDLFCCLFCDKFEKHDMFIQKGKT